MDYIHQRKQYINSLPYTGMMTMRVMGIGISVLMEGISTDDDLFIHFHANGNKSSKSSKS